MTTTTTTTAVALLASLPAAAPAPAAAAVAEQLQRHCADQRARLLRGEPSVFASPGLSVGAFLRSPHATGDEPDVQVTVHPWDKYSRVWASPLFSIATVEIANNQPNSRGRVALRTAVPTDPPLFDGPYLHDINDSRALRWAMREVRRIVRTPPLDTHIVEELVPGEHRQSEGELLDAIACGPQQTRDSGRAECDRSELPVNHLAGTCRLGPSIEAQANPGLADDAGYSIAWGCCGHVFHLDCISRWLKTRSVCPLCNREWEFAKIEKIATYGNLD